MPALPPIVARITSLSSSSSASADPRHLEPRQDTTGGVYALQLQYAGLNSGPAPGTVVGIVLGSVAGFLLLIWLLWVVSNGTSFIQTSTITEDEVVVASTRRRGSPRSHRSRRTTEMVSRSPPPPRRERVVRSERIVRESVPPPRERSRLRETILVEESIASPVDERRVEGDDIIEVMEEHSSLDAPPPRRKSRRSSGYRSVDPY